MITDKIKELEALKQKTAELEQQIEGERRKELAALPAKFGFADAAAFIAAVQAAVGKKSGRKPGRPAKVAAAGAGAKKRRKRAVITDETRAQVKKLVDGGKTGNEIAKELGISLPSVQNIKKALGLVQKRK